MSSTNPEAEVPEQSVTDRLESLFSAGEPPAEEPSEDEDTPEQEEAPEAETDEPESTPEPDEAEEVEFEGRVYKVPKELKPALLRQQDYTKKTQEVAEQRKAVEEKAAFVEEIEQHRAAIFEQAVELKALEASLQQYSKLDWDSLDASDPAEARRLERAQKRMNDQATDLRMKIRQAVEQEQQKTAERRQQMLTKGNAELQRDIKGWGPELAKSLLENGKAYGFNDQELAQIIDPRFVKALHDAYQWRKLQSSKPEVEKKAAGAKPMKVASRSAAQTQRDDAAALARQQLRRSGKGEHAEAFFEKLFTRKR